MVKDQKKLLVGTVISDKMDKTIVVKSERIYRHPRFHKIIKKAKKYKVHDENQLAKIGDFVSFFEGRPYSKTKYMCLDKVLRSDAIDAVDE